MPKLTIKSLLFITIGVSFYSNLVLAKSEYQTELSIGANSTSDSDSTNMISTSIAGAYFLSPVNTSGHALTQAAFLERASALSFNFRKTDASSTSGSTTFKHDSIDTYFGFNYRQKQTALTFSTSLSKAETNFKSPTNSYAKSDGYSVGIGAYLHDNLHAGLTHLNSSTSYDLTNTTTDHTLNIAGMSYIKILQNSTSIKLTTSIIKAKINIGSASDTNNTIAFGGDYYFNYHTSLGTELRINSGDNTSSEGSTLAVNITHFITPTVALKIRITNFSAHNADGNDRNTLAFNILMRN